jgi:AraC-like DNA-binding protein/ligand-binding sensor protein
MSLLSFDQISKLTILQQVYDPIYRLFGVNINLYPPNLDGILPVGDTVSWSPFCSKLREIVGHEHCLECDRKHLAIVGEKRHSLRYHCWAGLREFIIPIILDGEIVTYIQCGQVLDTQPVEEDWLAIRQSLKDLGFTNLPSDDLFFSLRVISPQNQEDLMALLEFFGNYIAFARHQILLAETPQQSRMVERAISFIRNHFTEPISLEDVAQAVSTSQRNLMRIFKAVTGKTVLEFIHEKRIERACQQLQAGELTCTRVAFDCGFGSVQQFDQVFQRLKQCTPQAWQRRLKDANNTLQRG